MKKRTKSILTSYLVSGPSLLLIALIVVFPILYTFFISLTNMNVYHWFDFTVIGLQNYWRALFVFDSGFLSRCWRRCCGLSSTWSYSSPWLSCSQAC